MRRTTGLASASPGAAWESGSRWGGCRLASGSPGAVGERRVCSRRIEPAVLGAFFAKKGREPRNK